MIRVFLLAVLALAALALVSHYLPGRAGVPAEAQESASPDAASPFAMWDGAWEGTLNAYRPDGTPAESIQVRLEHTTISPSEQKLVIIERSAAGRTRKLRGQITYLDGRIERRVWQADGTTLKVLTGRPAGRALLWRYSDPSGGLQEALREEIVRTSGGDLYTVDGYRIAGGDGGKAVLIEGRYRRAGPAGE